MLVDRLLNRALDRLERHDSLAVKQAAATAAPKLAPIHIAHIARSTADETTRQAQHAHNQGKDVKSKWYESDGSQTGKRSPIQKRGCLA